MTSFRPRTLTEYFQLIWRRRLLVFFIVAGMLISTFLFVNTLPNVYEAHATVVTSAAPDDRQAVNNRVAATTERLTSRAFLEPIVNHYDPYDTRNVDAAIDHLRQDLKIDITYRNDYPERLNIAYRHTDPAMAKQIADELVATFDKMNGAMAKQAAESMASLASEISDTENRLRDMGKLKAVLAAHQGASGRAADQANAIRSQRIAAASSIETLTDKQFSLEQQIAEQNRQIQEQQKIVKTAPSDAKASGSYGVLLVRKAELEGQLKDFSTQYTDKNPKVIQTRNQLSEINHQIAQLSAGSDQESSPMNSAEGRELRSMQRELAKMQTELLITQRELERKKAGAPDATAAPRIAAVSTPVSQVASTSTGDNNGDYESLRKRYESLMDRQDQLARAQVVAAGLDPGIFQIVDLPVEPKTPVGPNRWKYRLFGIALALGVAIIVALALEIPKLYSITDDRDVEYYLGVPVIAFIPETSASDERRSPMLALGRTTGALLVVVLLTALWLVLTYTKVFSTIASLMR
jgi:uncharacterized protein involved in exopolysaccharide biosynthesis